MKNRFVPLTRLLMLRNYSMKIHLIIVFCEKGDLSKCGIKIKNKIIKDKNKK